MRKLHIILLCVFGMGVLLGGAGTGIAIEEYSSLTYQGEVLLGGENLVTEELDYDFSEGGYESVLLSYCHWGDEKRDSLLVEDESVPAGTVRYVVTYNEALVRPKLIGWEQELVDGDWRLPDSLEEENAVREELLAEEAELRKESEEEAGADGENGGENESNAGTDGENESNADTDGENKSNADTGGENGSRGGGAENGKRRRLLLDLRNNSIGDGFDVMMRSKDRILADIKKRKIGSYEVADITEVEIRVNPATMPYIDDQTR